MSQTGSNYESITAESWVEQGRIKSQIRSNHGSNKVELWAGQRHLLQLQSNLLIVQHISLDWKTNPKINIGSVKSLVWACSKVWSYPGWVVRLDFRRKLKRSNEHYRRTKSNHESNRVESWVEQGRIMSRTGASHWSNRVKSWVEQGRIMSRTRSNQGSNRVELWIEQSWIMIRIRWIMGRAGSN